MSTGPGPAPTLPARATVQELSEALGLDIGEVQAVLTSRGEPCSADDFVSADISLAVAKALGRRVAIEARDLALEILYQVEMGGDEPSPDDARGRVGHLVRGVLEARESLDHEIESASEHWSIARMPVIDRSILRLGLYELRHSPETPAAVVVSEAVRLAHTYSTEKSGSFVNGVLATLARAGRG